MAELKGIVATRILQVFVVANNIQCSLGLILLTYHVCRQLSPPQVLNMFAGIVVGEVDSLSQCPGGDLEQCVDVCPGRR